MIFKSILVQPNLGSKGKEGPWMAHWRKIPIREKVSDVRYNTDCSPFLFQAFLRKRRAAEGPLRPHADRDEDARMIDVVAELQALDLDEKHSSALPNDLRPSKLYTPSYVSNSDGFCLSSTGFGLLVAFVVCLFVSAAVTMAIFCARRQSAKN